MTPDYISTIIDQIKEGDEKAFGKLFKLYASKLTGTACRVLKSKEVAQDIVQDVFCELWRQRSALDSSKKVKAQAVETLFRTSVPENSVENHINFEETKGILQRALLHLSEQQRTVYY